MYLHEPKASENAAYECNIQPFFTFMSAIMCLLPTFTIIIGVTKYTQAHYASRGFMCMHNTLDLLDFITCTPDAYGV